MTVKPEPQDGSPAAIAPDAMPSSPQPRQQAVGRRRALRAVLTGAVAALGAAVLIGRRPDRASASDNLGIFQTTTNDASPAVSATNSSTAAPAAVQASSSTSAPVISATNSGTGDGVDATSASGNGVDGSGSTGVLGSGGNVGVYGTSTTSGGLGIWGQTTGTAATVEGDNFGSGPAVYGNSGGGGVAVQGQSSNGISNSSIGVFGISIGSGSGIGVLGVSSNDIHSIGLYGISATGTGFYGYSGASGGVGAAGVNTTAGIGLYGQSAGGYAGLFSGALLVTGAMTVLGAKSAAVRGADGGLKRLYSMESPESWFEDFGSGRLSGGTSTVQLDAGFAEVVNSVGYHVFLTPLGDSTGWLYVAAQTPAGFVVKEAGGGTSGIAFSYRVVAKRKDIAGARLEAIAEPLLPAAHPLSIIPADPPTPPQPKHHGH